VSSRFPSKFPFKDRESDTHQARKSVSRKDKNTLRKASRSRTKHSTRRRSTSKKRSTSHKRKIHKNQVLHLVPLVAHRLKVTVGLVLFPPLLPKKVTKRQVASVLGNTFLNHLSSMEPNPSRFSGFAFVIVQNTIIETEKNKLIFLRDSLEAKAADVLWDYSKEVTSSLSRLIATLKEMFGDQVFVDKHRTELRSRCREKNETLRSLHADIRRLAALAFPTVKHTAKEVLAMIYFLDALDDPEFAMRVRERQPATLDAALAKALQMEVWAKNSRNRFAEIKPLEESKRTRKVNQASIVASSSTEERSEALQKGVTEAKKTVATSKKAELKAKREVKETKQKMAKLEARLAARKPAPPTNETGAKQSRCFQCGNPGRFARNCPNNPPPLPYPNQGQRD